MKRYCSFFLVLCLMFQCVAVSYASTQGWSVTLNGTVNTDTETYFAKLAIDAAKEYKYSGDNSLYLEYPGTTKSETEYMEIKNTLADSTEVGESYTLKFYIKGSRNSEYQEAVLGNTVLENFKNISKTKMNNAPSGQTGWYECVYDFTAGSEENVFMFRIYGGTNNAAIDDVSLVKSGTTDNLIVNAGFEDGLAEEEYVEEEYDRTPYTPVSMMASPNASQLTLSWVNPSATTLKKVSVYDITNGKNEPVQGNFGTTPSAIVYHNITGLTDGESYQYKIVFNFSDKGDFVYYLCGTPSGKVTVNVGKWSLMRNNSTNVAYCPGEVVIDNEVAHTGKASLRMRANIDRSVKELQSNIYIGALFATKLEVGDKYSVSFWIKGERIDRAPTLTMQWAVMDGRDREYPELKGDEYDWKQVNLEYTYTEKSNFYFIYDGYCKNLWLDDIEIYKLNEDGTKAEGAENLVSEGGFEDITSETVGTISDLTATPKPGGLDLEWKMSDEPCKEIEVYEKYYGKDIYIGTVVKDSKISLTNLIQGREYTYKLVPVNNDNVKGTPVEVTGTTILPDYEIGNVVLKSGDSEIKKLSGAGDYTITFSVKNNVFEDGMNVEQFVAVFDKDNVLWDIFSTKKKINKTGQGKPYTNISTSFTVPGDDYTVEYFVFDDRTTLNIIGEENPHKVYTNQ